MKRKALTGSWKKTPTGIRVSVSKLKVSFYCLAAGKLKKNLTDFEVPS